MPDERPSTTPRIETPENNDPKFLSQAIEVLRQSEERYRTLVESAQDPIFTSDADGRFLYVNTAAAARLGRTPDQVIGRTVDDLFPPAVARVYRQGVSQVMRTGETLVSEDHSEVAGREAWFSTVVQPVRDGAGRITAAQAIVRDITKPKQVEQALRHNEDRLHQAVRVSNIGIFDHNHVLEAKYWSPEQRAIYGWGANEPVDFDPDYGDSRPTWDLIHPDDRARIDEAVRRAWDPAGDGLFDVEHRIVRRDGSLRWLTIRSRTFFEGEGTARRKVRTVGATRDITEQKLAEEEREKLQSQLVQGQKMESIGRLAGGIAHDFNNMLGVIIGRVELALALAEPRTPIQANLEEVRSAARRSADLTRQLLTFARRQTVMPRVLDINEVVVGSLGMLRRIIGEDIRLKWLPGDALWLVRMDPSQIDQILANLSANARDAISGVGQVSLRTANIDVDEAQCAGHPGSRPGPHVLLQMTDDGRGMDADTLAHIFEPFFTTKAIGEGTGLGLATVYGIVRQNAGLIEVASQVGRGTSVSIRLPRTAEIRKGLGATPAAARRRGTETILLVEDEPMLLRLSQTVLEGLGYSVLPAHLPSEAIRLTMEHAGEIDLLVTDVVMPEMNGRDLAEQLARLRPRLKSLFVSGYPANTLSQRGSLEGGDHFLQKPFMPNDLAVKVREVLDTP